MHYVKLTQQDHSMASVERKLKGGHNRVICLFVCILAGWWVAEVTCMTTAITPAVILFPPALMMFVPMLMTYLPTTIFLPMVMTFVPRVMTFGKHAVLYPRLSGIQSPPQVFPDRITFLLQSMLGVFTTLVYNSHIEQNVAWNGTRAPLKLYS